ncbi:MAG: DUF1963 domain-containing protein, partial [Xenococcaceae cyanobacterium]
VADYKFPMLVGQELYNLLEEDDYIFDEYTDKFPGGSHKIGGYPDFVQEDPRSSSLEDEEPYILLLQIDSDTINSDTNKNIMWGDSGVCNFFIKESDLKKLDFTDVLYNWDCA